MAFSKEMPRFAVFHTSNHVKCPQVILNRADTNGNPVELKARVELIDFPHELALLQHIAAAAKPPLAYMIFADDVPDTHILALCGDDHDLHLTILAGKVVSKTHHDNRLRSKALVTVGSRVFRARASDIVYALDDVKKLKTLKRLHNHNSLTTPRPFVRGEISAPLTMRYIEGFYAYTRRQLPWRRPAVQQPQTSTADISTEAASPALV
ncbi:MAG: hypothetical protein AB7G06_04220 [Bdellovibrionales bacterium]